MRRFRNGGHRYSSDRDAGDLTAGLARQRPDGRTARLPDRLGRRTGKGNGWNRHRVRAFRSHRGIPGYREGERQERGELSLTEASARLGAAPSVARRQVRTGAPWETAAEDLEAPGAVTALSGRRAIAGADPNQREFRFWPSCGTAAKPARWSVSGTRGGQTPMKPGDGARQYTADIGGEMRNRCKSMLKRGGVL